MSMVRVSQRNEDVVILGDGQQTRDFVYVKVTPIRHG